MLFHVARMLTLAFIATGAFGQQAVAGRGTGTVTGHVYCADTNLPARFASVSLEAVDIGQEPINGQLGAPTIRVVRTALDGGFAITQVKPGTYYVVVRTLGYPSPLLEFNRTELEKPTGVIAERLARKVTITTVGAGQTSSVEVRIERGAVIAGRVLLDDGSPAVDVTIMVFRQQEDGAWKDVQRSGSSRGFSFTRTDDQGRFRVTDLPAGEFLVQAEFQLNESMTTSLFDTRGTANSGSGSLDNLSVYAGNVFRQAQAARIKLAAGEERSGEEIVVPISKLHTVSGSVVNRSGGVVNSGMVLLFDGQEKMPVARSAVNSNDGTFRFSFVPSGTYRLEAYGADVVSTEIPATQAGATGVTFGQKLARMYGPYLQPLIVQNAMTGLVITLPDSPAQLPALR